MPSFAQLQAEPWWVREVVTPAMDTLGDRLCAHYRLPRYHAGTKGDQYHLRGAHRSQEWLLRSAFSQGRTYTVQAGLTAEQARWIAGFDFTPGSDAEMVRQCKRLDAALRAGVLEEVTEFYGNVDGDKVVDGWDNIANRRATSDASHLWHWHLTIRRDQADNPAVMDRIFRIVTGAAPTEEDDMTKDELLQLLGSPEGKRALGIAVWGFDPGRDAKGDIWPGVYDPWKDPKNNGTIAPGTALTELLRATLNTEAGMAGERAEVVPTAQQNAQATVEALGTLQTGALVDLLRRGLGEQRARELGAALTGSA